MWYDGHYNVTWQFSHYKNDLQFVCGSSVNFRHILTFQQFLPPGVISVPFSYNIWHGSWLFTQLLNCQSFENIDFANICRTVCYSPVKCKDIERFWALPGLFTQAGQEIIQTGHDTFSHAFTYFLLFVNFPNVGQSRIILQFSYFSRITVFIYQHMA